MSKISDIRLFCFNEPLTFLITLRIHSHCSIVFGLCFLSSALLWGRESKEKDVRILQNDATGVLIEFVPEYNAPSKFISNSHEFDRYDFKSSRNVEEPIPGSPDIRVRSILLRCMSANENSVEIVKADYEDIPNVVLLPVADVREGEISPVQSYDLDKASYGNAAFIPERIAQLANVAETRGTFLGELRISPLQFNAAAHLLRRYSRIIVRVSFGNAAGMVRSADGLVRGLALNDENIQQGETVISRFKKSSLVNSVLSTGQWFRFNINEDGMYKLTGADLMAAGIPQNTDPQTIKVYGNGGFETPASVTASYIDDLLENALYCNDGGTTGQLDPADYVIFYAKGTRGWSYNPSAKTFSHYKNHYTETNVYWLTYGGQPGKKMTQVPDDQSVPFRPNTVTGKLFREDEMVNLLSSGLEWVGQSFNVGDQITYVHPLFGLDVSQPINYRFRVGARSSSVSAFTISEHNSQLVSVGLARTQPGDYFVTQFVDAVINKSQVPNFSDAQNQLRFSFTSSSSSANGYIDWYEIFYQRRLQARNDVFAFHTLDTTGSAQYAIGGFSNGAVFVFDVTRFDSVQVIPNQRISTDTCLFQLPLTAGSVRELYAVGQAGFKSPGALSHITNQNLHGDPAEADYIIVTHSDFTSAAQRLRAFREQPASNLRSLVVDVNQIYNEFGGGLPEPAAIRNYLRYVYLNWSVPPKYVLLFGDGDYDYKRIIATGPNWIPPWETFESFLPLHTYASDDDYGTFDTGRRVAIGLGRLTAHSLQEANTIVDKIIEYESNPIPDPWKERVTFVADDGLAGSGEPNNFFLHTGQAETLSGDVPPLFEERKIFEYEYPTVFTPGGRRKPEVNLAIQNQINQGTLVLNYTGHGNPRLWAHEAVFVRETDFPLLHNKGKYFILVAATCNYSFFDAVNDQSGGELLASMPNAGAIGVFSATRVVFAGDNFDINTSIYKYLFATDSTGRILPVRLGDVIYRTKQDNFGGTADNDRKFFLLGDPALQVSFPKMFASIDTINQIPNNQAVQLQALGKASVKASVRDTASNLQSTFNGKALLVVYDSRRTVQLEDGTAHFSFVKPGGVLFRGEQTITNGSMDAQFVVPKDISYSNDFGRITLYFWNTSTDGAGYSTNIRIGGTDTTAATDVTGPQINLYLDKKSFRSGDVVSASPLLIASLRDDHGINTSSASVGHRIEAWLDSKAESIDLSDYYQSNIDSFQTGSVEYPLSGLSQGTHRLKMRAWDTYNNSSVSQTVFDVVTSVGLQLSNIYNYPNPFASSTIFTLQHNQLNIVDAEVKIYTVAGRLIQILERKNLSDSFIQIPWDGRDREGDALANGVYLYKVIVKTQDGRLTSEALGKLSIMK